MNTSENSERIDDWASRLIDGDIVIDDVEVDVREAVMVRAEQFRMVRETMLRSRDDASASTVNVDVQRALSTSARPGRARVYITGLAAAAAVATIVGVAVSSSGRSEVPAAEVQTKVASMDASTASAAPEMSTNEMSTEMSSGDMSTAMSSTMGDVPAEAADLADACPDDLRPTIIPVATINGEDVEIHWSAAHGVVVYRISDCSVVLATTP
jgi:hypothetical protein